MSSSVLALVVCRIAGKARQYSCAARALFAGLGVIAMLAAIVVGIHGIALGSGCHAHEHRFCI
jgi:hypothetical protein